VVILEEATAPETKVEKVRSPISDEPMARPSCIKGFSYKLKWHENIRSIYMHVNYITDDKGHNIPFELFFKGGDSKNQDLLAILGRMASSRFRHGGDCRHIVNDFIKEASIHGTFDKPVGFSRSFMIDSLSVLIGYTLLDFMFKIDYVGVRDIKVPHIALHELYNVVPTIEQPASDIAKKVEEHVTLTIVKKASVAGTECKSCGDFAVVIQEGCESCKSCGHSKCG
jgi:ribonucleoside-diphosphate reductase alpha chain